MQTMRREEAMHWRLSMFTWHGASNQTNGASNQTGKGCRCEYSSCTVFFLYWLCENSSSSTATSRPTRPNGWISIHVVGNLSSMDGIPTTRWKSIQWMEIPLGVGWISHHLPPKWMDGNPTILEPKPGLKISRSCMVP